MSTGGRRFTRPRTRVYDANYNIGENYYRDALTGLDRKYGVLPTETIPPPPRSDRPLSVGSFDSLWDQRERGRMLSEVAGRQMDEELQDMRRVARARAREPPSAELEFENAFTSRREEVKKRFSDKLLDSVGLDSSTLTEDSARLRQRRAERLEERAAVAGGVRPTFDKWTALGVESPEGVESRRALHSTRARLADIESEMEEMALRGEARERRLAGLKRLLNGDLSSEDQDVASLRLRKTVVTTSTEKRAL